MMNVSNYTISDKSTARDVLQSINEIAIPNMAIFIVNDKRQLLGSITDGDIRRGLLNGLAINEPVTSFMNKKSKCLVKGENNFEKTSRFKALGIRFIPVVDQDQHILDIVDLEQVRSIIPADVILMAGGKGERLKPLTEHVPKSMLKIGDKPIIIRNIERLKNYGIANFYVSVGHLASKIISGIKEEQLPNVDIKFIEETKPLGTIGSVKLIKDTVNDTLLLMNSDLLTNIDFQDFYKRFVDSKADILVATIPYTIDVPYAVMNINDQDEVLSFQEKPRYTYYSNAGIYIFKKELIALIPDNERFDATHFMEAVIANKKRLISYPILGYWLDIGRMDDFYKAQEDVKHIRF
jgi:dTDP-glucose pyrophosphorylase